MLQKEVVRFAHDPATSYASAIQYAAQGAIVSLPRGDGVTETTTYNSRQQPVTIQAGNLLTLSYDYGGAANNGAGVNNNGNVLGQTVSSGFNTEPLVSTTSRHLLETQAIENRRLGP